METRERKIAGFHTFPTYEVVFGFTLDELYWLISKIPKDDKFHNEIDEAITELEKLEKK